MLPVIPLARKRNREAGDCGRILVVDDQQETLVSVKMLLEREGHHVMTAPDGEAALTLFQPGEIDMVIVDYFMPGMTGEGVVERLRQLDADVQILLQTGYSGQKPPLEMLRTLDIQGYHDKTDGPDRLLLWVEVGLKAYRQIRRIREAERLKSELVANVSHELRTPVQIILGYTEVLTDIVGDLPDSSREMLETVKRHAVTLSQLINDFLAFARSESRTGMAPFGPVTLAPFEADCREIARHLIDGRPVDFRWEVDPDIPPLLGDRRQVAVILRNLVSNASKFTAEGEIVVRASEREEGILLQVSDTGAGIAPENQTLIFDPFRQIDGSDTRNLGGTGLGLALVRKLAQRMGTRITVDSEVGRGSTFTLLFPKSTAVAPESGPEAGTGCAEAAGRPAA